MNDNNHPALADITPLLLNLDGKGLRAVLAATSGLLSHQTNYQDLQSVLMNILDASVLNSGRMADIATLVAWRRRVTVEQLKSRDRRIKVSAARLEAYALCHATGRYSTTQIGRFFNRDHSTVVAGIQAHRRRIAARAAEAA